MVAGADVLCGRMKEAEAEGVQLESPNRRLCMGVRDLIEWRGIIKRALYH